MRALVVSNMLPAPAHPERGRFVRDQVAALALLPDVEVSLYEFPPGPPALARAVPHLRRLAPSLPAADSGAPGRWDIVHAHFGLTAWPALAMPAHVHALTVHGTDIRHPRSRILTAAVLPFIDLLAAASPALAAELPTRRARERARSLPCGVDVERFHPIPRSTARNQLGLAPEGPYVLFPADPSRASKRHDRALALADAGGATLLTLGGIDPDEVPLWVNAANAVLIPSEREGFGLAALEALACDVPVLATPVGIHPEALAGVQATLCAPFDRDSWLSVLAPHLHAPDPRIAGRPSAERFSAVHMAERVRDAWIEALRRSGSPGG